MLPIAVSPPPKWMRGLIFLNKKVEKGAGGGGGGGRYFSHFKGGLGKKSEGRRTALLYLLSRTKIDKKLNFHTLKLLFYIEQIFFGMYAAGNKHTHSC